MNTSVIILALHTAPCQQQCPSRGLCTLHGVLDQVARDTSRMQMNKQATLSMRAPVLPRIAGLMQHTPVSRPHTQAVIIDSQIS
jgi:hypothetical protein